MAQQFSIDIERVVELVGLYRDPRAVKGAASFNVQCPFCGDTKFHMNIDKRKNSYRCVLCGTGSGALDLYGRLICNTPCVPGDGGNSKTLFKQLCDDLKMESPFAHEHKTMPQIPETERASDSVVDHTYRQLLAIPEFALSEAHMEQLLERGLEKEDILRNEYRSICRDKYAQLVTQTAREVYEKEGLKSLKTGMKQISGYKDEQIIAGLEVANTLLKNKCQMQGVPGFFKLGSRWCICLEEGLLIPTRNIKGEIVALQVRKDSGRVRYKTISAKTLPNAVTIGISRAHFPIGNCSIKKDTRVLLTEGPLKADVALRLIGTECAFVAIHGVNNTAELESVFAELKNRGVTKIYNALDMDRTTNLNVARASRSIRVQAEAAGLDMGSLCWDKDFAKSKAEELETICSDSSIDVVYSKDVYTYVANLTKALADHGIAVSNGWNPASKGIDDYLYNLKHNNI